MKTVFLSGKGGTGKTTVTANLAALYNHMTILDCDVEEPNSHIYLSPRIGEVVRVSAAYPQIDEERCVNCGLCAEFCNYNAIISGSAATVVMKELCHDCGGCSLVCPRGAISFIDRPVGSIHSGKTAFGGPIIFGELDPGELSGVGIIDKAKERAFRSRHVLIDSPPGTSCSAVAAVEGCDFAVIVAEPTPFGVSDMKMVVEMLRQMSVPFSVLINKAGLGNDEIYRYCREEDLEILEEIPFSREMAKSCAEGRCAVQSVKDIVPRFLNLMEKLMEKAEARL